MREEAHRGKLNGFSCGFTPHGRVGFTRYMVDGLRVGPYRLYYDGPPPRLHVAIDFLVVAGKEHQNYYEARDSLGRLLARTGRLRVQADRDTVALGDSLVLRLRVEHPQHPLAGVSVGGYDAAFVLRDSAAERRAPAPQHALTLRWPTATRGAQVLRGFMTDFDEGKTKVRKATPGQGNRMYFAYPYFVR
ncbi:hypothetical protein QMK33_22565 [Hymenobacter sp. H14-R3]|uniref:hypothetical protein n=1 Tax=Hymenobacter sp. H14-R3 TaxID=3046308 RepID=UPI0024BB6769|nr:hypothetical protein [Hymenobacter sp. H14-R3]MDJ0367935.1 hypothetical protein [Hymenobacter sp. H14-R3]